MEADVKISDTVREDLGNIFSRLILGPLEPEEVLGSNPSDTYLTGILWPRGIMLGSEEDDAGSAEHARVDPDEVDSGVPGYRAIRPCSIGMTFVTDASVTIEIDLADTSRYVPSLRSDGAQSENDSKVEKTSRSADEPASNEEVSEPKGRRIRVEWKRYRLGYRMVVRGGDERTSWRSTEFIGGDGKPITDPWVALDIKRRVKEGQATFTVTLINMGPELEEKRDTSILFQSGLRARAVNSDQTPAIIPRPAVRHADDEDSLVNMLIYREVQEYASGHGTAVRWPKSVDGRVEWVETAWLPETAVKGMSPAGHSDLGKLTQSFKDIFAASWLSRESAQSDVCDALDAFCGTYGGWIKHQLSARVGQFEGDQHRAADRILFLCETTLVRMKEGAGILRTDPNAWVSFAVANAAMDSQSKFPSKGGNARPLVWRPFQLAFMLLVIPSLVRSDRADRNTMDLLWFPTGGGKTEAYLALTAFAIFLGRLRSPARRADGGVEVLMRYTLRLLTVQQFQRAAALIIACDVIRSQDVARFGKARISIGLYVGGDSTPNRMEDALARIEDERIGGKPTSTPRQLLRCPVCGGDLPPTAYRFGQIDMSMEIVCPESTCASGGTGLPVMTVDETIYAHPPSLVIGTVDKFAQLPRRTDIRRLFGLDTDEGPGLIIQDELHLISGPLGSMAGLYESVIDMLCTRNGVRPKLIGSTATIGRAKNQIRALFDRDVLQFPPTGFDADDSFFAVRDETGPDRLYVGLTSAGRSPKFALQAALDVSSLSLAGCLFPS